VVEGDPLVCAFSFDCEGGGAVVAGNTSCDDVISSKCLASIVSWRKVKCVGLTYSFLKVGITNQLGILGRVGLSLDGLPFACLALVGSVLKLIWGYGHLHIEIVNVVPNNFKTLVLLINLNGKPDVSALPDRRQIPLSYVSWESTWAQHQRT
jgi:hypothetical protein